MSRATRDRSGDPDPGTATIGVLFVCMGNICRSPMAEAVFRHKVAARGASARFVIDSCGTGGWHTGEPADARTRRTAARYGVSVSGSARRISRKDFTRFDQIICMDEDNREDVLEMGAPEAKVRLLMEADPALKLSEVPDPYYGGADGFETIYVMIDRACEALLDELLSGGTELGETGS